MINDFRLRVFQCLANKLNFTKTAKELNISQPAVSNHIAELEQEIGDTLFNRQKGNISLTPKGKILLDYADRILYLYESLNNEIVPQAIAKQEELFICSSPIGAKFILPPMIDEFHKAFPNTMITIRERDDIEIINMLKDGSIDIGILLSRNFSYPEIIFHSFVSMTAYRSQEPILELFTAYNRNSHNIKLINSFILNCKTFNSKI